MTVLPSEASPVGLSTTARCPPEARSANPISCVVGKETASTTRRTGNLVISLTSCEILASERLRSRTFVTPIAFRCSVCFSEAVVMIGESPDNFASWMPTLNGSHLQRLGGIQKNAYTVGPPSFHLQGLREGFRKPSFLSMSRVLGSQVRVERDGVGLRMMLKGPREWWQLHHRKRQGESTSGNHLPPPP